MLPLGAGFGTELRLAASSDPLLHGMNGTLARYIAHPTIVVHKRISIRICLYYHRTHDHSFIPKMGTGTIAY